MSKFPVALSPFSCFSIVRPMTVFGWLTFWVLMGSGRFVWYGVCYFEFSPVLTPSFMLAISTDFVTAWEDLYEPVWVMPVLVLAQPVVLLIESALPFCLNTFSSKFGTTPDALEISYTISLGVLKKFFLLPACLVAIFLFYACWLSNWYLALQFSWLWFKFVLLKDPCWNKFFTPVGLVNWSDHTISSLIFELALNAPELRYLGRFCPLGAFNTVIGLGFLRFYGDNIFFLGTYVWLKALGSRLCSCIFIFLSECWRLFDLLELTGAGPMTESLFLNSFIIFVISLFLVIYSGCCWILSEFT